MLTEQRNPLTEHLDQVSTLDMLYIINDEDAKIAAVVRSALPDIAQAVDSVVKALQNGGRLIYVGAGSSGRIAIQDAAECVPTYSTPRGLVIGLQAGGEQALTDSVEGTEDRSDEGRADLQTIQLSARDIVVGIAASGRTPYVLGAVQYANDMQAVTVGISCNRPAPLLELAHIKIALPVGPEVVTGSTRLKAGTAQKMVLNMLSTGSMIKLGKVYGNLMVDVQPTNEKLVGRACRIIAEIAHLSEQQAAELLRQSNNEVKTAIVVSMRKTTPAEARELLAKAAGRLREVIG
jgi:N-acetylmuramic acid 6-phosphate etherase